jgi:putative ABC transport system permease protein
MYRNFIISAWRNLAKYKVYAVINFIGLAVGMALVLLIFSNLRNELSYDRFHDKADRLYRLSYLVPNGRPK